jgi:hypothetical protein
MTDNKQIKPIVVIYLPNDFYLGGSRNAPMELMKALNANFGEDVLDYKIKYSDYWKDYYWFSFYDREIETPRFEVFYSKDFTEIQYAELKKIIENAIQKNP